MPRCPVLVIFVLTDRRTKPIILPLMHVGWAITHYTVSKLQIIDSHIKSIDFYADALRLRQMF